MPDDVLEEIVKVKKLLALLLYHNGVAPLDIAKAGEMSPNEIYKFVSKKKKSKTRMKSTDTD